MTDKESKLLKIGDLVTIATVQKDRYKGLVLEVESIDSIDPWPTRVTMKQPGFDNEFRISRNVHQLKRYEP